MTARLLHRDAGGFIRAVSKAEAAASLNLAGGAHDTLLGRYIDEYQAVAEAHANRYMRQRSVTERWLVRDWLPVTAPFPTVADVASVETFRWRKRKGGDWTAVDASDWELQGDHILLLGERWPWASQAVDALVEVSYTAGLATGDDELQSGDGLVLRAAVLSAVRERIHGNARIAVQDCAQSAGAVAKIEPPHSA